MSQYMRTSRRAPRPGALFSANNIPKISVKVKLGDMDGKMIDKIFDDITAGKDKDIESVKKIIKSMTLYFIGTSSPSKQTGDVETRDIYMLHSITTDDQTLLIINDFDNSEILGGMTHMIEDYDKYKELLQFKKFAQQGILFYRSSGTSRGDKGLTDIIFPLSFTAVKGNFIKPYERLNKIKI